MFDKKEFFRVVRENLGKLDQGQVEGLDLLVDTLTDLPLSWAAYGLATDWHETQRKMQPVREGLRASDQWRKKNLRYYPHYGRGYVQLTWLANYEVADKKLTKAGLIQRGELVKNPDLALRHGVSAFILKNGMQDGWFTGKKFSNYLPKEGVATRAQYIKARWIINIQDKADLIEDYAQVFEKALRAGGKT